jgi:hypothetical protein
MNPEKFFRAGSKFVTPAVIEAATGSIKLNVIFNDEHKTAELLGIDIDSSYPTCDCLTDVINGVIETNVITIEGINNDAPFKIYKIMNTDHIKIKRLQLTYD